MSLVGAAWVAVATKVTEKLRCLLLSEARGTWRSLGCPMEPTEGKGGQFHGEGVHEHLLHFLTTNPPHNLGGGPCGTLRALGATLLRKQC